MNFQSSYDQISTAPPIYDLKLTILESGSSPKGSLTQVEFVQRVIFNTGEVDFSGLIEAVKEKKNYKCTYSSYGCSTEYVLLDNKFVINRISSGGSYRVDFDLTRDHDFVKAHIDNLQLCLKKCVELGKNLPNDLKEYITHNQQASYAMTLLQEKTIPVIHRLYAHITAPVVAPDTAKIEELVTEPVKKPAKAPVKRTVRKVLKKDK